MQQPNILVISDRADFAQWIMGRWHSERSAPGFTVVNSELYNPNAARSSDLVIVGAIDKERSSLLMSALSDIDQPVILVVSDGVQGASIARSPRIMVLREHEGWVDLLILLASECLRRVEMMHRAERAETALAELGAQATLGRYMLEMRHGINNALTSILGNAELLLMEPGQFPDEVRDQLSTIRSMSLRLTEIIARFSSLEAELSFAKREATGDTTFVRGASKLTSF